MSCVTGVRGMRLGLVFCGALALMSSAPAAADWYKVATSSSNSVWYMDPARVTVDGQKVQAWVRIDGSHDSSVKWSEMKQLLSFDCAGQKVRVLSTITYDTYGKVLSNSSTPDYGYGIGYDPIVPDSMGEDIERLACAAPKQ